MMNEQNTHDVLTNTDLAKYMRCGVNNCDAFAKRLRERGLRGIRFGDGWRYHIQEVRDFWQREASCDDRD